MLNVRGEAGEAEAIIGAVLFPLVKVHKPFFTSSLATCATRARAIAHAGDGQQEEEQQEEREGEALPQQQ